MSGRRASAAALLAAALALACVGSRAERAARLRTELVGAPGEALLGCLGEPAYRGSDPAFGDVWAYLRPLRGAQDIGIHQLMSGMQRGRLGRARLGLERGQGASLGQSVPPGGCLLVFGLRDDAVRELRAIGRTADNLNADVECALTLAACRGDPGDAQSR